MMGSMFNPILWLLIIMIPLSAFYPYFEPYINDYALLSPQPYYEYDNVDDDIFELKYITISKFYIFKATHIDVPDNQWQDMVFTSKDGLIKKQYLSYCSEKETVRYGHTSNEENGVRHIYENTYVCKTDYPDKTGYWEPDTDDATWFIYLPIEKRTGDEVNFTILCYKNMQSIQTFFTYYVIDENGEPQPVDRIYITYSFSHDSSSHLFTIENESHSLD